MAKDIIHIIEYYSHHDVSDETREKIAGRLSVTANDKDAEKAYRSLWNEYELSDADKNDTENVYKAIEAKLGWTNSANLKEINLWRKRFVALVTALIVIAGIATYYYIDSRTKDVTGIAMQETHTIKGVTKQIHLVDGTRVKLSQESVLLYPSAFKGKERNVFLIGEASFDVSHKDDSPFHVSTPYFEITDLGTSFTVSSYVADEEVSTILHTGKIKLRIKGSQKEYQMSPQDCIVYNVSTKEVRLENSTSKVASWQTKQIDIDDLTLEEACKILERNYGVKFEFKSHKFKKVHITVHLNRGETLKGAMNVITGLIPDMEVETLPGKVIIK